MNIIQKLCFSIIPLSICVLLLLSSKLSTAQNLQLGVSLGASAQYVHEHHYGNVKYYEGVSFQTDFTFLDSNNLAKYGFSAYSNSVKSFYRLNELYRYNGMINNTGLMISRYFEKQFSKKFRANLQLSTGLNLETDFYNRSSLMLNIAFGAEVKYAIADNWFLLVKGIAMGQDVPNIVRYYTYGDFRQAGEDLHLISLFGVATNIGRK